MFDFITASIENPSFVTVLLAYFGGVLASLTPCVYPMIPILIGIIGAADIEKKSRGFTLSLSYSLGIALVYAAMGMIAALTGGFFGEIATNPWSYLVFGNLCLILSFWMMDWINIPIFSRNRTTGSKGHIGVFITGALSGIVAAPCTSPVLAGLLVYVAKTKDVALGGSMLFSFSIGMTTLLILIGTFSGVMKSMPKPGEWMVRVKKVMALVLFIFGEYFLIKAGGLLI